MGESEAQEGDLMSLGLGQEFAILECVTVLQCRRPISARVRCGVWSGLKILKMQLYTDRQRGNSVG